MAQARKVRSDSRCWDWSGYKTSNGYGQIQAVRGGVRHIFMPHRIVYEAVNGAIPEGMEIDHLCRNRSCINPVHMRVVTSKENTLCGFSPAAVNGRKTHCIRGHALNGNNLRMRRNGKRTCNECVRIKHREAYYRKLGRPCPKEKKKTGRPLGSGRVLRRMEK